MAIGSKLKKYVFNLESGAEGGTAFLIAPNMALTVAHAIGDNEKLVLVMGARRITAKAKKNVKLDIAVLLLDEECSEHLRLYDIEINETDKWITFGYPNFDRDSGEPLDDEENRISMICNLEEGKKHNLKLKCNDKINDFSGYSGSPLIVNDKVVGIINAEILQRGEPIRLTALSVNHFRKFVEENGVEVFENTQIDNDFQELEVIKVNLRVRFSSINHMTSLLFQPEIQLEQSESNRPIIKDREEYSKKIAYLLELAKNNTKNALSKDINFILMPEYSIHGIIGIDELIGGLRSSDIEEQILIGGIEGLTKNDFVTLLGKSSFKSPIKEKMKIWASQQPEGKWFNVAIIIEKFNDEIMFYLQPKMLPSPVGEVLGNMAEGKWVVFFSTNTERPLHFFNLICYDWVGSSEGKKILNVIAKKIIEGKHNINMREHCIAFVPQYNPQPNHLEFKNSIKEFLCNCPDWSSIHGRNAITFMLNVAANKDKFGETSIIINNGPYNCQDNVLPTYSIVNRKELEAYTDVIFRQKRECIHAVELAMPFSIDDRSNSNRYPCIQAIVHTIDGQPVENDPRYPNPPGSVCGYSKVLNDFIDIVREKDQLKIELETTFFEVLYNQVLEGKCSIYRTLNKNAIMNIFDNLFNHSNQDGYRENCDYWTIEIEGDAFKKFISFMCLLDLTKFNIQESEVYHAILSVSSISYNLKIVYIKESSENKIVRSLRELLFDRDESGDSERLLIIIIGNISNRILGKITDSYKTFGSLYAGDVFCKLNDVFNNISEKADGLNEILELRSLVEQTLGGRA